MTKKLPFFILFALGLVTGAFFYWLISFSLAYRAENRADSFRLIASTKKIQNCSDIKNLRNMSDNPVALDFICFITNTKTDTHGASYKIKSTVKVRKTVDSDEVSISVRNKIKSAQDYATEADYCDDDCSVDQNVNLSNLQNAGAVANRLVNVIEEILDKEEDNIEEAVGEAYKKKLKKEKLKEKIANCEVSKRSTVKYERTISPEEKIECRRNQLAEIENSKKRTDFFHSTVKPDLWYLINQDDGPIDKSFFLSEYMRELKSPDFFNHDYFSVRSAIDTAEKYNDLRWFMEGLNGEQKTSALKALSAQLPLYFYTNSHTPAGRQDRRFLETAWNKNFEQSPFPSYYSLSQAGTRTSTGEVRMSANEFRSIVNSPEFKSLYNK